MVNSLRLAVRAPSDGHLDERHELRILVDGQDVFGEAWGGMGRDPDALLGADSQLAATDRPRHVAVQRCGCGEEGCGSVVARIRRAGDQVIWDEFSEGSGDEPSSRKLKLDPFRFDVEEYEQELERAHRNRLWESPNRRTARLVGEALRRGAQPLADPHWVFDFAAAGVSVWRSGGVAESTRGVMVSLRSGGRQIVIDFPDEGGVPEERAEAIIRTLVHADPVVWRVSFKGGALAEWAQGERDELGPGRAGPFLDEPG
ncbi:MAG: hypothetical protein QOH36_696 [Actinomycetota bacterium]|nr:hypothetical protein [Actinomycetota bacterium]